MADEAPTGGVSEQYLHRATRRSEPEGGYGNLEATKAKEAKDAEKAKAKKEADAEKAKAEKEAKDAEAKKTPAKKAAPAKKEN